MSVSCCPALVGRWKTEVGLRLSGVRGWDTEVGLRLPSVRQWNTEVGLRLRSVRRWKTEVGLRLPGVRGWKTEVGLHPSDTPAMPSGGGRESLWLDFPFILALSIALFPNRLHRVSPFHVEHVPLVNEPVPLQIRGRDDSGEADVIVVVTERDQTIDIFDDHSLTRHDIV